MNINYVNIKNETIAEYLKSAYIHTSPIKDMVSSKPSNTQFLTKSFVLSTIIYSFNEEFKNRIMFDNNNFQIGEINDELQFNIEVYNNSEISKTIEEINIINLSGIDINVESFEIEGYKSQYLNVKLAATGESNNNGFIQLIINGDIFYITLNYSRQAIFSYMIDRSSDLTTSYVFNTEIRTSLSGKEYRDTKADVCRFMCDYNYKLKGDLRRRFESEIINNKLDVLYLPMYFDKVHSVANHDTNRILGDFSNTNIKQGSSVFAYQSNYQQILDVISVTDTYIEVEKMSTVFSICLVYPLVRSRISSAISGSQVTKEFARYLLTFDIDEYESEDRLLVNKVFDYPMLNGKYFFDHLRRNKGEETKTFNKKIVMFDNNNSLRKVFVQNSTARETKNFTMKLFNKTEISKVKDCFNKVKGMHKDFYIIKDDNTLKLLENIDMNDTIVRIADSNSLSSFENFYFDYVYIVYNNVNTLILKVNEVRKDENNREILLIDPAETSIDLKTVNFISYICKARFNNDTLSITYKTDNIAETNIELMTINKE